MNDITRRAFVQTLAATAIGATAACASASRYKGVKKARHIAVIGAGAFGGWTALALLRSGFRVSLIDAWGAGHARASSGGETRVIRAVYGGVPVYTQMAARARKLWRIAEEEWRQQVLFPSGALWLFADDDAYARRSLGPLGAAGLRLDELSRAEAQRRFPQMNFSDTRSVYFEPDAGFITARRACGLVLETFVRLGGEYRQAWVQPITSGAVRLDSLHLSEGTTLRADEFVFACGPWLGQMFPETIGARIRATRQEVFFFGTPPGDARFDYGTLPAWVHMGERVTYGLPNHDRRGLKIADDSAGAEVDPNKLERIPTERGLALARTILSQRFPDLAEAPLLESRVCQYEASRDGNFLIDRHPHSENTWLVGGGSGHGFKMGPAIGESVAALIQGERAVEPLFAYR
jgi:glycine/D-amino acid oxidase-like deaminating enzyme